jgi:hypothetical protein
MDPKMIVNLSVKQGVNPRFKCRSTLSLFFFFFLHFFSFPLFIYN